MGLKSIIKSFGPGFIIAAVVLGPGSLTTAAKIGSTIGYDFLWVILIAAISMIVYTNMSTRFGLMHNRSILNVISEKYGRWLSMAIGISSFIATLSFQFGNNLGVGMGMETLTGINAGIWPIIFTFLAIILIFYAKNLYKILEKIMMYVVIIMILTFVVNLVFIKPDIVDIVNGFVPKPFSKDNLSELAAIAGTTFVLNSALYQSYLVQNKGWGLADKAKATRDSNLGIFLLALMTVFVIATAASALKPFGITINSASDMAIQLETLMGSYAKYIFAIGFSAAAFSSLLVNAVIGGGLLSDGLGLGQSMEQKVPKIFTMIILLVGMGTAMYVASATGSPVYSLIMAQASSIMAVPLIAIGLFLVLNNKSIMGEHTNSGYQNILSVIGFVLICILVYIMYDRLIGYLSSL
ncbi:Nramp family divalent metal transporter [Confluentibacter flavum]|uniref:Divalent metal cation transporter n=1 Tax=Confluentibacter flavum TaxID=1909700 RepID=A0A2N3HHI2_9FLAO|nr:Nramp family divalent metal transporter [Confluentibacter flavum]PKQ44419.1 divalent metal cation transporter [Confluentibacter flavum]